MVIKDEDLSIVGTDDEPFILDLIRGVGELGMLKNRLGGHARIALVDLSGRDNGGEVIDGLGRTVKLTFRVETSITWSGSEQHQMKAAFHIEGEGVVDLDRVRELTLAFISPSEDASAIARTILGEKSSSFRIPSDGEH